MVEATLKKEVEAHLEMSAGAKSGMHLCVDKLDRANMLEQALAVIITEASTRRCNFCYGYGHDPRQCGSKKNIDRAC